MVKLLSIISSAALFGSSVGGVAGNIYNTNGVKRLTAGNNVNSPASDFLNKITNTDIKVPSTTNPDTTNPDTISAIKTGIANVNSDVTVSDLSQCVFSHTTLSKTSATNVTITAVISGTVAQKQLSVTFAQANPAEQLLDKIQNTSITVPSNTNLDTSNPDTISAMKTQLQAANPSLTSSDLANLLFSKTTLSTTQPTTVTITAVVGSSIASKDITVAVGSSGHVTPDPTSDLSNYDISKVAPPSAPNIDYNKVSYSPWFDDGFNWQQFLDNTDSAYDAGIGKTLINNILDSSNQVVRLGFITSFDSKAITGKESGLVKNFEGWVNGRSSKVSPAIGGIIPLWMANWTDAWGAVDPGEHQSGSAIYQLLTQIRNAGKDYEFSFGGWNHDSLAMKAYLKKYTAQDLANLYAGIIDNLKLKIINFDIEGTISGSTDDFGNNHPVAQGQAARKLLFSALHILKSDPKYNDLKIELTYPDNINGMSDFDTAQMVQAFKDNIVFRLNLMPFDYQLWGVNKRITLPGEQAVYAMSGVNAMAAVLQKNGIQDPFSKISTTLMAGINDSKYEVTTLTDMQLFVNYAITKKMAGFGFWSSIYDMENQIYNAAGGNFRTGHNFGDLWTYQEMVSGSRAKDAYSAGLHTKDLSYTNIAKNITKGSAGIYNYNGKIDIPEALWQGIEDKGVITGVNPSAITNQNIIDLYSNNFVFSKEDTNTGFGAALTSSDASKQALQTELNWSEWAQNYLDKNLK